MSRARVAVALLGLLTSAATRGASTQLRVSASVVRSLATRVPNGLAVGAAELRVDPSGQTVTVRFTPGASAGGAAAFVSFPGLAARACVELRCEAVLAGDGGAPPAGAALVVTFFPDGAPTGVVGL